MKLMPFKLRQKQLRSCSRRKKKSSLNR